MLLLLVVVVVAPGFPALPRLLLAYFLHNGRFHLGHSRCALVCCGGAAARRECPGVKSQPGAGCPGCPGPRCRPSLPVLLCALRWVGRTVGVGPRTTVEGGYDVL